MHMTTKAQNIIIKLPTETLVATYSYSTIFQNTTEYNSNHVQLLLGVSKVIYVQQAEAQLLHVDRLAIPEMAFKVTQGHR